VVKVEGLSWPEAEAEDEEDEARGQLQFVGRRPATGPPRVSCFTEMCSGSEAGSYLSFYTLCITQP